MEHIIHKECTDCRITAYTDKPECLVQGDLVCDNCGQVLYTKQELENGTVKNFAVFTDKDELTMIQDNFRTREAGERYIKNNNLVGEDYFVGECDEISIADME